MEKIFLYNDQDNVFIQNFLIQEKIIFIQYKFLNFPGGEFFVKITHNVWDKNVFVLVNTSNDIDNFQKIIFVITELRNKGAKTINIISLFIPYLRQFSEKNKINISDVFLKNIFYAGADCIITFDPHCKNFIHDFQDKIKILSAKNLFIKKIKSLNLDNFCFVAPDKGAQQINSELAKYFGKKFFSANKQRSENGKIEFLALDERYENKNAIIVDDMIDTGETLNFLVDVLIKKNSEINIFIFCTHPILSKVPNFLDNKQVKFLFVTNSIKLNKNIHKKILILDLRKELEQCFDYF